MTKKAIYNLRQVGDYHERAILAAKQSFARDYYDEAVAEAQRGIEYNAEEDRKERERTDARNLWVRELRASLNANEKDQAQNGRA